MSTCSRCGAAFGCAMADGGSEPCWCTRLPPLLPVPEAGARTGCWCPACLEQHIALAREAAPDTLAPAPGARE